MRRCFALLLVLVVLGAALGAPSSTATALDDLRWAYYVPDDPRSYRSLRAAHPYLDVVVPDAWRIQPNGSIRTRIQPGVIAEMRAWGLSVIPMVQKYRWSDKMHGFFASPAARSRAASTLAAIVIGENFDGIHIDIEHIEGRDGPALEAFVADLGARLHAAGKLVTIALPARTAGQSWHPAFDYARLGAQVDLAVVMAYDHGYAAGWPAPVAPLAWVRDVAAYTASQIPREKVLLGIPWYGYDWNVSTRRLASYVSFFDGAFRSGRHTYDEVAHAASVYYVANGQHHYVWYENARSVGEKQRIASEQALRGWAAWRLGYEDPAVWAQLERRR